MRSAPHHSLLTPTRRLLARAALLWLCFEIPALAQFPTMYGGPDSAFEQIDFAQMSMDKSNRDSKDREKQQKQNQEMIDSGALSALDLEAPGSAINEFNLANSLLKAQKSKEAIKHLQKALANYPKFVSAHIGLGLAYVDQEDTAHAKSEFEAAATLDAKFPGSYLHLGQLALSQKDFGAAESALEKAVSIRPTDARCLSTLAYAQNGAHDYRLALETARRVHALPHQGIANVHYVAASAAMAIKDFNTMERELTLFLGEDPTNAFAPVARQNLAALTHNKTVRAAQANAPQPAPTLVASQRSVTFPNSDRLKAQLNALGDQSDGGPCDADCGVLAEANPNPAIGEGPGSSRPSISAGPLLASPGLGVWTIHTSVDDVAVFFSVSQHGHMINDLEQSDIQIRDDNKPPKRIMQFSSQSKLPLRLALLVDTSGSVHDRFLFEKKAAAKFVEKVLNGTTDLGFIAGFATEPTVTQDFSAQPAELGPGIEKLTNGGGTALFDAVSFACRKLAAYPESEHVARVLVILSDGEDNSSHGTLKQSIMAAERAGVTIYTVSTREDRGDKTDADRVLEALAESSGGEAMFPGDVLTLNKSFDKLHDLIRSRYFIAYKPADFHPDGSYRAIAIVAEKDGKHMQVRARKGYHARVETKPN